MAIWSQKHMVAVDTCRSSGRMLQETLRSTAWFADIDRVFVDLAEKLDCDCSQTLVGRKRISEDTFL